MTDWRTVLREAAADVEGHFDELKHRLALRHGWLEPLQLQAYLGYGTPRRISLRGRVLRDRGIVDAADDDTLWRHLLDMFRRFGSDEVPGARVRARVGESVLEVVTDQEGFFQFDHEPVAPLPDDRLWHDVELELLQPRVGDRAAPRATGRVLVPMPGATYGVISDVDDTIVRTDATNLLLMARIVFLHNVHVRLPFKGVAAFYQALHRGADGASGNPLFYVSSSPWNLYDLLVHYLEVHDIPLGPLFLQDWGLEHDRVVKVGHREHKLAVIGRLLATYPALPFVLIGDSGQEDAEIYHQVVVDHPGRVAAIYIRDVRHEERDRAVEAIAREVERLGAPMLLVEDTLAAARHAAEHGLIAPEALPAIGEEKRRDERPPLPIERALGASTE